MHTLVIASQKGGVGKTTLAGHIAVMADVHKQGPVAVIDTDPQGSLAQWWNSRKTETPVFATVELNHIMRDLQKLRENGIKLAIIDTPPAISDTIRAVIAVADIVLIPTRPSPHDLRAIGSTVEIAEELEKRVIFVINGATVRAKITGQAAIALSQHGTVAPVTLHHRLDFATSMIDGRTAQELDAQSKSATELLVLYEYLFKQLHKNTKKS